MSGICGICQLGRPFHPGSLQRMLAAMTLPAESTCETTAGDSTTLGLAQRWSFQQVTAIPGIRIAVDAELFNEPELMGLIQNRDSPASPLSLAELLARLYLKRGVAFVELLHGVFAVALWDERARRLVLAIDRLGVKTLYWRQEGDRLLFASRVGAIRVEQHGPAETNLAALMQYLMFSVVPAPLAIYHGVEKLRPGHRLVYQAGQVHQSQYWDLDYTQSANHDERYWAREVHAGMRSAVHVHLSGCEPEKTGAYLSGGTDSSSVVAFMNECHAPVNTFSIFFQEGRYNEINFARITAERFHTRHHERRLNPNDALEAIPKLIQYYDEPLANSSAIGAYYCARLARETGVDTLLAGDGGDELFAGNERYALDKYFALYHSVPNWLRRGLLEPMASLLPPNDGWLSLPRRYVRRAQIPNPRRILSYNHFLNTKPEEVFDPAFLVQVPPETWMGIAAGHFQAAHAHSELNRILYLDVKVTLADNDLRKVSGTAELAGVRARFPLLDYRLAELSARVPSALKLKGFKKRYIFKQAMRGILPDRVLSKKKHGFGVPLGAWFLLDARLNALVRDVLMDQRTRERGYFRREFIDRLIEEQHRKNAGYYGEVIWYLLALELWHRQHLEAAPRNLNAA